MFDLFSLEERVHIAGFLQKLAIRVQKAVRRQLDVSKAGPLLDTALSGNLSKVTSYLSPSKDFRGKEAALAKATASRTYVPGNGSAIRSDLFIGPITLRESSGSMVVLTSGSRRDPLSDSGLSGEVESVPSLVSALKSRIGGASPSLKIITTDTRSLSDRRYKVERTFKDGKRAWQITDKETGKPAWYVLNSSASQDVDDPYREAIFFSSRDAVRVLNTLTRSTNQTSRSAPSIKENIIYIKYSSTWVEDTDMYSVLDSLIPSEASDRSLEMERRLDRVLKDVADGRP